MSRLTRVLYVAALLVFGAALPGSVQATDPDAERCPGRTAPVCRETSVEECVAWYRCNLFLRCCKDKTTTTRVQYFPDPM